jgi:uncharacterized protein YjiS (DUF1127 family)
MFTYIHVGGRLAGFKGRLVAMMERRRERAQIRNELLRCSDRDLFDLGISRADIPAVVNGTYRR